MDQARGLYDEECRLLESLLAGKRAPAEKQEWSEAARRKEIGTLSKARDLGAAAVAALDRALAAME